MNRIQTHFYVFALVLFFVATPLCAVAAGVSITPVVVDLKEHARDIDKEHLTLKNQSGHVVELYPFVYGISPESGVTTFLDPSLADESTSLANWIQLSRASIMLKPGETRDVPYEIDVNLRALPAVYHASIIFAPGATRDEAEKRLTSGISANINVEVLSDAKERLQLRGFAATRAFWFKAPVSFEYRIENVGNRPETPTGEIRIYTKSGEEVGSVALNPKNEDISPDGRLTFTTAWQGSDTAGLASVLGINGFGKYKAILDIQYGPNGAQTLQDTAVFWIIPIVPLALLIIGVLVLLFFIRPMIHRRHYHGIP